MPMIDVTLPRGRFDRRLRDLAARFGVAPGDERWDELRFDQR